MPSMRQCARDRHLDQGRPVQVGADGCSRNPVALALLAWHQFEPSHSADQYQKARRGHVLTVIADGQDQSLALLLSGEASLQFSS